MKHLIFILTILLVGCGSDKVIGPSGKSYLIDMARTNNIDLQICESQSGLIINSGLDQNYNLILDSSEILQSEVICDGLDGVSESLAFIKIHDPCGNTLNHVDEIIFELDGGIFIAWYKNIGLTILDKNTMYKTTDHQKCKFKITDENEIIEL